MLSDAVRLLVTPGMWLHRNGHKRAFRAYCSTASVIARGLYLAGLR